MQFGRNAIERLFYGLQDFRRISTTQEQFRRIESYLPTDTHGKGRVDDRRVISGIVHVVKSGGRWIDAPLECGPRKTLYNRYVRWAAKGVWCDLFHALTSAGVRGAIVNSRIPS